MSRGVVSVHVYFIETLGDSACVEGLGNVWSDSPEGKDCIEAIDNAREQIDEIDNDNAAVTRILQGCAAQCAAIVSGTDDDIYPGEMSIAAYYRAAMGHTHPDATLITLPVNSPCGLDCMAAIDAARAFRRHIRASIGTGTQEETDLLQATETIVSVYWRS